MNTNNRRGAVIACGCAILLVLSGCASAGGTTALTPHGLESLPSAGHSAAAIANVAGRYHGKFSISGKRVGDASFDLTQSATAVGGSLTLVLAKQTLREPVAMTLDPANNSFTGSATDPTGTTPCTYALSGSYNPKTFILRGTSAPRTCAGKKAAFTTTERCFYNTGSGTNASRLPSRDIAKC